jgi:hypothetical protein
MTRTDTGYDEETRTAAVRPHTHRSPETKTFLASSEFWVAVGSVVALFIGGYWIKDITKATAWQYSTWVAIAYVVSRGIAKAGSRRDYQADYGPGPVRVPPRQVVE